MPAAIIDQYGCGPVHFGGTDEALYERHLLFDNVVDLERATARDRFEALARSVRDVLSQRWLLTEKTYEQQNPKRLYYLSMEFLIGRSLEDNVTNLLLAPVARTLFEDKKLNRFEISEQEPDAGWGTGGLGGWQPASWNLLLRSNFPPWATDFDMSTACSSNPSATGGSRKSLTTGCVIPTHGRSLVLMKRWRFI